MGATNTGAVVYDGPSAWTGERIIAVITYGSDNNKTGDMDQLWILPVIHPQTAWDTGGYLAVCGGPTPCPHYVHKTCYEVRVNGPRAVWQKWIDGGYRVFAPNAPRLPRYRPLRLGADGDPANIPIEVIRQVLAGRPRGSTGYTHQWPTRPDLAPYCMASCETAEQVARAEGMGFRTYQTTEGLRDKAQRQILCPASVEAGKRTQCVRCGLCDGSHGPTDARAHIYSPAHGARALKFYRSAREVAA